MERIRTVLVIAGVLLLSLSAFSQELSKKEQRRLYREFLKEQRAEEARQAAELVGMMVLHRKFVLEADQLRDRYGNSSHVSSMINFIAADSITGVIQVGNNTYMGLNGVGGVTVEGPIANYDFTHNKKSGSYYVNYTIRSSSGTYDIRMIVSADGGADATISSSWPGRLTYMGDLVPPGMSKVFKGRSF